MRSCTIPSFRIAFTASDCCGTRLDHRLPNEDNRRYTAKWRLGRPRVPYRYAHISGQSSCPLSPNSKTNQLLRAACRDWTGSVKINRPNCLIPKPLTLTFHAGRIWPVYLLLFGHNPLRVEQPRSPRPPDSGDLYTVRRRNVMRDCYRLHLT